MRFTIEQQQQYQGRLAAERLHRELSGVLHDKLRKLLVTSADFTEEQKLQAEGHLRGPYVKDVGAACVALGITIPELIWANVSPD